MTRRRSAGLAAFVVVALAAATLSLGRSAAADAVPWPANPNWQQYVLGPATPNVTPVAVVSTSGNVTNAGALVTGGSGSAKLTMVSGGPAPVIILDYGKNVGGFPYFTVAAQSGNPVLRASYSEGSQYIGANGDGGGAFNAGDRSRANNYTVRGAGTINHSLIQGGERFQRIALTSPGSVTLSAVGIRFSAYRATANEYQGYFVSSSDELNKIWYAGAYTNQLSMLPPGTGGINQLPLILDGAKRDRNVWIGDIYVEGPTNYVSLGSNGNDYLKQSIRLLGSYQLSSGFVTGCLAPQSPVHTGPLIPGTTACYSTSYSLYFAPDLADYYRATGDLAFVRSQFPVVQRQLGWNASRLNSQGLLVTDTSDGLDWDWYDGNKTGAVTAYNALYYLNLIEAAYLARETGQVDLATQYTNKAAALRTAINANLFNSSTGVYDLSDKVRGTVTQDANAEAVLFGVAPASAVPGILTKLKSTLWGTHGPRPFSGSGYSTLISPFISGIELNARLSTGDTTGGMQLVSDVWGQMVRPGPNYTGTMWENIKPDGSIEKGSTSLAHGWSSAPTSALTRYVLGARPVDAGYATWIVQPQPGSLSWTAGQVPTPHGPLAVKWGRAAGDGFDMDVTAPNGTSGTIAVPASGADTAITVNGTSVWDRGTFSAGAGVTSARSDGSYVYMTVSASGNYRVSVRAGSGEPTPTQRYEAETAPAACQGRIDSNHSGFSGTGFCNADNTVGAYSQFTVNAPAAGTATIGVRFANGGATVRPGNLVVNGATVTAVSFEGTGAWTTWVTKTVTIPVNAGNNTIRFSPTTAEGLPNVDFLEVGA
ncbi:alpha-L-rhamnosidase C-terminal domain-containing protein [Dactylosporangium sp. NPDC050588]|uniref:alpha-L-rhamnosidase-related protein n=1 Tax=Dactylosporangium sp. NPDC050588 TaxID=3157211 RepID=UPI00340B391C